MTAPKQAGTPKVATQEKLSVYQKMEQIKQLQAEIENERKQEMLVSVEGFVKKVKQLEFSKADVLAMLHEAMPDAVAVAAKSTKATSEGKEKTYKGYTKGVTYKDPAGLGEDWAGGSRGARAKWLIELISATMPLAEQQAAYAKLAKA